MIQLINTKFVNTLFAKTHLFSDSGISFSFESMSSSSVEITYFINIKINIYVTLKVYKL
jgi:hypothetical protein